jgi:hypothetical protein
MTKKATISHTLLLVANINIAWKAMGWTAQVRFPAAKDFCLLHSIQTSSGAHPVFYPMGTGGDFPWSKEPEV